MKSRRSVLKNLLSGLGSSSAALTGAHGLLSGKAAHAARTYEVMHSDVEWKKLLSPNAYRILRKAGTERPHTSPLNREKRAGIYSCAGCALPLFSSSTKFESGTGWPSFWQPLDGAVVEETDTTLFIRRTEVLCRRCGGHLGHVFKDGPKPTGLRYCMNGVALAFKAA